MNVQSMPEAPVTNGAGNAHPGPRSTNDSLVDSTLDALADLGTPDNDAPGRPTRPGRKKQSEQDAPETPEGDQGEEEDGAGESDEEGDEGEQQQTTEDEDDGEEHDARGSKDEPFTVKDLPANKFIELKVDGEKTVVSFKELATGYIREQTFSQRINKTKELTDEATAHAQRFQEERQQLRTATREFLQDADQLYEYFTADEGREQVLTAVAQRLAAQLRTFRENPETRLQYQRQRDQKRLEEQKAHWEAQKQAEAQAAQQREAQARFEKVFKPGWESGLKRAGFPEVSVNGQVTPQGQALWDEVMVRLNQRHQTGKAISPADVEEFVYRAAKLLELPPRNAGKKPKPAPVSTAPKERRRKDAWDNVPKKDRVKNVDYFLKNLRPRDFR
jgi:hypothetical protein